MTANVVTQTLTLADDAKEAIAAWRLADEAMNEAGRNIAADRIATINALASFRQPQTPADAMLGVGVLADHIDTLITLADGSVAGNDAARACSRLVVLLMRFLEETSGISRSAYLLDHYLPPEWDSHPFGGAKTDAPDWFPVGTKVMIKDQTFTVRGYNKFTSFIDLVDDDGDPVMTLHSDWLSHVFDGLQLPTGYAA